MGKKILIMDDVSAVRRTVKTLLKRNGYEILEAADGKVGYKILLSEKPDLVIADLMMPEMDGFDFLRIVRSSGDDEIKNIPVIVLTAKVDKSYVLKAMQLGANKFVIKPFDINDILLKIRELLPEENE